MPIVLKVTSIKGREANYNVPIPPDEKYNETIIGKKPDGGVSLYPLSDQAKLAQRYLVLQRPEDDEQPWKLIVGDDGLTTEIRIGDVVLMGTTTQATVNLGETIAIKDVVTFQLLQAQRRTEGAPTNPAETT